MMIFWHTGIHHKTCILSLFTPGVAWGGPRGIQGVPGVQGTPPPPTHTMAQPGPAQPSMAKWPGNHLDAPNGAFKDGPQAGYR